MHLDNEQTRLLHLILLIEKKLCSQTFEIKETNQVQYFQEANCVFLILVLVSQDYPTEHFTISEPEPVAKISPQI